MSYVAAFRPAKLFGIVFGSISYGILVATLAGFASRSWPGDLAASPRGVYLVAGVGVAATLALLSRWRSAVVATVGLFVNIAVIAPLYVHPPRLHSGGSQNFARITVVQYNAQHSPDQITQTAEGLISLGPDVVAIEELSPDLAYAVEKQVTSEWHKVAIALPNAGGIGIYSRLELRDGRIRYFADSALPSITANVVLDTEGRSRTVGILATHPLSPVTPSRFAQRNAQLRNIVEWRERMPEDLIIAGDLNVVPWASEYREFSEGMRTRSAAKGFGIRPTWPARIPVIPIDHILVSESIGVADHRVGPKLGSDHRPVIAHLEIPVDA